MSEDRLRRAVELARSRGPSPEAVARMQASLNAATVKPARLGVHLVKPWLVGAIVAGAAIAGAIGARHHRTSRVETPAAVVPAVATSRATSKVESHAPAAPEVPTIAIDDLPLARSDERPTPKRVVSVATDAPDAETELSLVQGAQAALASDPARALALAERHAAKFPHGELVQEREVTAIEALAKLSRVDEAKARGARFLAANPQTPYRLRVERALAAP